MMVQGSPFDQPIARSPPPRQQATDRGTGDIGQRLQPKPEVWRQSDLSHVPQHGIVQGIDSNASAIMGIRFRTRSSTTDVGVRSPGAFRLADLRPTPAVELNRIRALLSEGLLRDARTVIAEALGRFPDNEGLYALSKLTAPSKATRSAVTFPRRAEELRWLDEHRDRYKGRWVALLGNVLIASADTMKQLLDAVAAKNIEGSPLVHKVV